MSIAIDDNRVVGIHYTLTNTAGDVLDSSQGAEPLEYLHGAQNIIPGLEKALMGKTVGDALQVTVPPEEGYGERQEALVQNVEKSLFSGVEDIQVGMQFQAQSDNGQPFLVTVAAVDGDEVTVDGNHPLAGEELHFDVSVESVRDATEEEVAHGHAH